MEYTKSDLLETKRQIDSVLRKTEKVIETLENKENPQRYKSQIALAKNRVKAFTIANGLIEKELRGGTSGGEVIESA